MTFLRCKKLMQMNRTPYIPLVLTVLLAAACTKPMPDSEISDSQSTSRSYIFFEPEIIEAAETRADIPFEHDSFGVMGFVGNSAVFSGHTGDKAEVRKEGDLYTYSPLAQWQGSQNHNFYGFYPYSLSSSVNTGADYIPYITYTQPTTLASMLDVMTAKTGPVTKQSYVTLTFTHRLWALDVKVKNSQKNQVTVSPDGSEVTKDPNLTIVEAKLYIYGIPASGNISLGSDAVTSSTDIQPSAAICYNLLPTSQSALPKTLASTKEETFQQLLFIPCNGLYYRLEITFKNSWGAAYLYTYPDYPTPEIDDDGKPIIDASAPYEYNATDGKWYLPLDKSFDAGKRYSLTVEKIDATANYNIKWAIYDWYSVDVDHTFN